MTNNSPEPNKPPMNEKIADVLVKFFVAGSGGSSLYFLFAEDIPKAIIAGFLSFGASLMTNFGQGVSSILNPRVKKLGEDVGEFSIINL